MSRKYNVGITFNLESQIRDIWSNGVNQNLIFLYQLFEELDIVKNITFVCWGPEGITTPDKNFMLENLNLKFSHIDDVIEDLDLLIEGSLSIEPNQAEIIHKNGGKVICYKMGNDYIYDIEAVIHNKSATRIFNGTKFDANWIIPQNMNTNSAYFSIMHRCPSRQIPFIWSPVFCDKGIAELNRPFGYINNLDKSKKSRRISSFEPNISIFKNSFTDILIAEQAYRQRSDLIEHVYMCNTYDIKDHPTFFNFIGRTNLVKDGIMSVEKRFAMPLFLSEYTDIVLSTQWENGLNYAYNDALYGGYPFIHNSKLLPKGVGYYYDQFDAFEGARVLIDVIENHDKYHDTYVQRANEYLDSLHPHNPINLAVYELELKRVFE